MKRRTSILHCLLCLCVWASADTLEVGEGKAFRSIRKALEVARNGDSIRVSKGTYREGNILIRKSVFLIGSEAPVLDGEGRYEIMTVRSNFVIIEGFVFRDAGRSSYNDIAALRLDNVRDVVVRHNRLENSFFGIYCQQASRITVEGNTLLSNARDETNSANGIHCWKSDGLRILGNAISGHRDGIYFEFVTNSLIQGNHSRQNVRYGLHFMFSSHDVYTGNEFSDNGAGVSVMFSKNVTMLRNRFSDNWGNAAYGILMKEISDSEVADNAFERNTVGIFLEGSNRIRILRNSFHENGWAIRMQASCNDNLVASNNFTANTFDVATNGSLVLNLFRRNYWDRYEGYDLDRDGTGDVPHRPVSLYAMIVERNPATLMLFRSLMADLIDRAERMMPGMTPEDLKDEQPRMRMIPM